MDAAAEALYFFAMTARRTLFDPLEASNEARWYVVRSAHGAVVDRRFIAPGTDLKRLFASTLLEWIDAGWSVGEFSSCAGTFFCSRGVERRTVSIQATDPDNERWHGGAPLLSG